MNMWTLFLAFPSLFRVFSPPRQPLRQAAVPRLDADRHLHLPEGVLAHKVGEPVVHAFHEHVRVGHAGVGEQQKLGAGQGLEDREAEKGRLQRLDARR